MMRTNKKLPELLLRSILLYYYRSVQSGLCSFRINWPE